MHNDDKDQDDDKDNSVNILPQKQDDDDAVKSDQISTNYKDSNYCLNVKDDSYEEKATIEQSDATFKKNDFLFESNGLNRSIKTADATFSKSLTALDTQLDITMMKRSLTPPDDTHHIQTSGNRGHSLGPKSRSIDRRSIAQDSSSGHNRRRRVAIPNVAPKSIAPSLNYILGLENIAHRNNPATTGYREIPGLQSSLEGEDHRRRRWQITEQHQADVSRIIKALQPSLSSQLQQPRLHPPQPPATAAEQQEVSSLSPDAALWKLFLSSLQPPTNIGGGGGRRGSGQTKSSSSRSSGSFTSTSQLPPDFLTSSPCPSRLIIVSRSLAHQVLIGIRQQPLQQTPQSQSENSVSLLVNPPSTNSLPSLTPLTNNNGSSNVSNCPIQWYCCSGDEMDSISSLTMDQIPFLEWNIEEDPLAEDMVSCFPPEIPTLHVTDPGIDLTRLSSDAEVQQCIGASLSQFMMSKGIAPVMLTEAASDERFSEEVLSPLFYHRMPPVSTGFYAEDWSGYCALNDEFLTQVVRQYQPGDWILVLDYHLLLLPRLLRENMLTRDAFIACYLSSVFPSSEVIRILPEREELLKGMLASSFLGFHGFQYKRHFLTACTRVVGIESSGDRIEPDVYVGGGLGCRVVTLPRGINTKPWTMALQDANVKSQLTNLVEQLHGRKVILGVDSLNYTRGIPNKLLAFSRFLAENPEAAGTVTLVQVCIPRDSRWESDKRREILNNAFQLAGLINATHGTIHHVPVHLLVSPLTMDELVQLYCLADVLLLAPLRESLSRAAYEFVLCQSLSPRKGVLVLSEFSSSAACLGAAALRVNPWDCQRLSEAIALALNMGEEERGLRLAFARDHVLRYDNNWWAVNLLIECRQAVVELEAERRRIPRKLDAREAADMVLKCKRRVLILGVRGTLLYPTFRGVDVELMTPKLRLPRVLDAALRLLSSDPSFDILAVSSATVNTMQLCLGHFAGITLLAENGHFIRLAGSKTWENAIPEVDLSWMEPLADSCRYFEERTPGSVVVRTATSISFNYANAQREHGTSQARDLLMHLWSGAQTLMTRADIVVGHRCVEVRSSATSKGQGVENWLRNLKLVDQDPPPSILVMGNFMPRDEELLGVVERQAKEWNAPITTFTVGLKPSRAKYYLPSEKDSEALLVALAAETVLSDEVAMGRVTQLCTLLQRPKRSPKEQIAFSDPDVVRRAPELQCALVYLAGSNATEARLKKVPATSSAAAAPQSTSTDHSSAESSLESSEETESEDEYSTGA